MNMIVEGEVYKKRVREMSDQELLESIITAGIVTAQSEYLYHRDNLEALKAECLRRMGFRGRVREIIDEINRVTRFGG